MDETDQDSIFPLGKSGLVPPQGGSVANLQHTHNYGIAIYYPTIVRWCTGCGATDILDLDNASFPYRWKRVEENNSELA